MSLIENRYAGAVNSSNLKPKDGAMMSDLNVLGAAGMAAQENEAALMLWDVAFRGKTSAKLALVDSLAKALAGKMMKSGWKGDPKKVAMEVLAWQLHGTCQPCNGLGYEKISGHKDTKGRAVLSDRLCRHCNGTKKVALPRTEAHQWMSDYFSKLFSIAAGKTMQKIAGSMIL